MFTRRIGPQFWDLNTFQIESTKTTMPRKVTRGLMDGWICNDYDDDDE